jgi:hypothetical protein
MFNLALAVICNRGGRHLENIFRVIENPIFLFFSQKNLIFSQKIGKIEILHLLYYQSR